MFSVRTSSLTMTYSEHAAEDVGRRCILPWAREDLLVKAQEASNELIKADFLDLESRWLLLTQSYRFRSERDWLSEVPDQSGARPLAGDDPS